MDLLPPDVRAALLARFPLDDAPAGGDAPVAVKFFFPLGRYTLLVTGARDDGDDVTFFGYCVSALGAECDEWGYTCLSELQSVQLRGLTVERDLSLPMGERTVAAVLRSLGVAPSP